MCGSVKAMLVCVTDMGDVSDTLTGENDMDVPAVSSCVTSCLCLIAHFGAFSGGNDNDGVDCTRGFCLNPPFFNPPSCSLSSFCIKEFNSKSI